MKFRIREARENAGYSQKELAQIIGVAQNTFHGYESGKHDPKSELLYKIADACNVTVDFLLGRNCSDDTHNHKKFNSTDESTSDELSGREQAHLKKYRLLDPYGKEAVDGVLDVESRRCEEDRQKQAAIIQAQREKMEAAEENIIYIFPGYSTPMSAGTGQLAGEEYPENYRLVKEPPRGASYIAPVRGDSMEPTFHDGDNLFIRTCEEIRKGQIGVFFMDGKQWVKELGDGVLISHNPDPKYAPRAFTEDIRCQGLVLGVCDESYFE